MGKAIKWGAIIIGGLVVVVIAALLIAPMFVDVQKYKPDIENWLSETAGRPIGIGKDLRLSLFPWVGFDLSDIRVGNPPGFKEKDFVTVKSADLRIELLPLLSRDIQVKRFILKGPRIVLVKRKDGQWNFEDPKKRPGKIPSEVPIKKKGPPVGKPEGGLPIKALAVREFAITKGSLLLVDHAKGERKEISDLTLRLKDVSLDRPVRMALSFQLDGKPFSLEGKVGPIGKEPGKGIVLLDISLKALNEVEMGLKGQIVDPVESARFNMALQISRFSPRKLMAALGQTLPVKTADPKALNTMALKALVVGNKQEMTISEGKLDLDESKLTFSLQAKEFSKPNITFDMNLDHIDLDRYLPPPSEKAGKEKPKSEAAKAQTPSEQAKKPDYAPLRRLVLNGAVKVGKLKVKGARIQDLNLKVTGRNGVFNIDPLALNLYQGSVASKMTLDVRGERPKSKATFLGKGIQAGPLLKDVADKDLLEGVMNARVAIQMQGDEPKRIKKSLNGKGELLFTEGAIKGYDLSGMARNVKAAFGLVKKGGKRRQTEFSEFRVPFTITNGRFNTPQTILISPLIRLQAEGDAELVKETLDFRVNPKFVATLKGQGDKGERSGIMVPLLIGGTFSSPKFRPDLKGIITQVIEGKIPKLSDLKKQIPTVSDLEKILGGEKNEEKEEKKQDEEKSLEEEATGFLKSILSDDKKDKKKKKKSKSSK